MLNASPTRSGGLPHEPRHRAHAPGDLGRRVVRRLRQIETADMTEAEPEKSLPDVPMHQRGFGLMDDDVP